MTVSPTNAPYQTRHAETGEVIAGHRDLADAVIVARYLWEPVSIWERQANDTYRELSENEIHAMLRKPR